MDLRRTLATKVSPPLSPVQMDFSQWPYFQSDEIEAVIRVLKSGKVNYWTGSEGRAFEAEFSQYHGTSYAIALANGTVALELAMKALGIGKGDEVITTSRSFIASASAAVLCGARPIFADVDEESQNISVETIERVLTPRTRAIVAVHLAGWPCEMDPIMDLAARHGLMVIEDCAQAHGAMYKGRLVGSIGHAAAFSFCQDKIMTTGGEGGMLVTSDPEVWRRAWAYKDHGKSYEAVFERDHPPGFRWLHESIGTNMRMTEMQAAIGRICLSKLDEWVAARRSHASALALSFKRIPGLRVPMPPAYIRHSYYKFYSFVEPAMLKNNWTRDRIMEGINAAGVPCLTGSCSEIYLEKAFEEEKYHVQGRNKVAQRLGETSLMFLVHPTLTEVEITETVRVVTDIMREAVLPEAQNHLIPFFHTNHDRMDERVSL